MKTAAPVFLSHGGCHPQLLEVNQVIRSVFQKGQREVGEHYQSYQESYKCY